MESVHEILVEVRIDQILRSYFGGDGLESIGGAVQV
jgi:hypothetical protein